MTAKGNYILWLPLWYPNRTEPYSGDFIQRHARAASAYRNIEVLVVIRDKSIAPGTRLEIHSQPGDLSETIIYYNTSDWLIRPFNRVVSFFVYYRIMFFWFRKIIRQRGIPSALHLHVYGKNCYIGWRLSQMWKIPLYYSEHQSALLKESPDFFLRSCSISKLIFVIFVSRVKGISFVSNYLGTSFKQFFPKLHYSIIPNVVDDSFFIPLSKYSIEQKVRFIHISTLTNEKDFEGIVQAFQLLVARTDNFLFHVFGPFTPDCIDIVKQAGLSNYFIFHGEQPHKEILPFLQSADALILYSRFETFGCVVIEALSCGTPVIVSDISAMKELVREGENGQIVPGADPEKLAERLAQFIHHPLRPDRALLHKTISDRFGMIRVGQLFEEFYRQEK